MRKSWETMTSVSAGHIILTPTQPVGGGRPQQELNQGPPHQESRPLPTELSAPQVYNNVCMPLGMKIAKHIRFESTGERKYIWRLYKMN